MIKALVLVSVCALSAQAQRKSKPVAQAAVIAVQPQEMAREIRVSGKTIVPVHVRVWRDTWLMFPEDERILTVANGDKDNFVTEYVDPKSNRILGIKPGMENRTTNLHVLTSKGNYSFILKEASNCTTCPVDLKVYVQPDQSHAPIAEDPTVELKREIAQLSEAVRLSKSAETDAKIEAKASKAKAESDAAEKISVYKRDFPASLDCDYSFPRVKAPFLVGAICTDGSFTYVLSRSQNVETVYAEKADGIALVQFDYIRGASNHQGVYIVTGKINKGYLQSGKKKRLKFHAVSTQAASAKQGG